MSRNLAGLYTLPSVYEAEPGETILAEQHNTPLEDLQTDANTPRPIVAGGTGTNNSVGAFDALAAAGVDVASASTLNLDTASGPLISITGSTTVTAVTLASGRLRIARAAAAFTLTAGAKLIVNGSTSVSYTTGADDLLIFEGYASATVRVWSFLRSNDQRFALVGDQRFVPTGAMMDWPIDTPPTGWLLLFGQAVSRTTYAALFALLGTTYGAGDGSTTFNLPDTRGRVTAGQDDMGGTAANRLTNALTGGVAGATLGAAGGEQGHTLGIPEMPSHQHPLIYTITQNGTGIDGSTTKIRGDLAGSTTSNVKTDFVGGGGAHNNVQPTLIVNKIIKT